MGQNVSILYIKELFMRLSTSSPTFFKVIQAVASLATAVTGLPEALKYFNINLPDWATVLENKTIAIASGTALFISLLTTQSTPKLDTADGSVYKETDAKKLPFTANNEAKKAVENEVKKENNDEAQNKS